MALSQKTLIQLAEALKPEVINFIYDDERFHEFMMQIVPEAINATLGDVDDMIAAELSMIICERINLT